MTEPFRKREVLLPREEPFAERAIRWSAGLLAARPWFDRAGLFALKHWFFPASRLWAAARQAHGDPERFYAAVPMPGRLEKRTILARALLRFEESRAAVNAIESEWQRDFFGAIETPVEYRTAVEGARIRLRHAYNATRRHFVPLLRRGVPRSRLEIAPVAGVEKAYAAGLGKTALFTAPPAAMPAIEMSRPFPTPHGSDFWLRFKSPSASLGDEVYARVHAPAGVADPPTVIFGHGICVEFDHWRGLIDEAHALVEAGFRVIRPEAPWHGRRVPPGYYGGERIIATVPAGPLDALLGAVREWSVLAHWARQTSAGPLAFAGSSLGALTSQLAASAAHEWPDRLRPDALLLITHSGDLADAMMYGALSDVFAGVAAAERAGWTPEKARSYFALLEPPRPPVVPAARIVSVLGRRDVVLPFRSGSRLVEDWCVPVENVFVMDRGHFSVPMSLIRDTRALRRFIAIMRSIG